MIQVITESTSNRLKYVLDFVFREILALDYILVKNKQPMEDEFFTIYYTDQEVENELFLYDSGFLSESHIEMDSFNRAMLLFDSVLEHLNRDSVIGTDIFTVIFICISRYEEYLPNVRDEHGRFRAVESISYRKDFLARALVDELIITLAKSIGIAIPDVVSGNKTGYRCISTVDIDQPWAFAYKGCRNFWVLSGTWQD